MDEQGLMDVIETILREDHDVQSYFHEVALMQSRNKELQEMLVKPIMLRLFRQLYFEEDRQEMRDFIRSSWFIIQHHYGFLFNLPFDRWVSQQERYMLN